MNKQPTPDPIDLNNYSAWVSSTWVGTQGFVGDLTVCALGLAGETGEAVDVIKKYLRDGELNRQKLIMELGDLMYYWATLCEMFGLRPEDVLKANIEKLTDRKERGVLNGQGDNR